MNICSMNEIEKIICLKKHKIHFASREKNTNCVSVSLFKIRELINSQYLIFKNKDTCSVIKKKNCFFA